MVWKKNFDTILKKVDGLLPIAKSLNCTLAQLAIAWCIANPNVSSVITGASKVSQIEENFASLDVVPKLTPQIMEKIEEVLANKPKNVRNFRE